MRRLWILAVLAPAFGCGVATRVAMPSAPPATSASSQAIAATDRATDYYPMGEDLRWIYEDGPLQSGLPRKPRSTWFLDIRRGDQGTSMIGIQMRNQDRAGQVIRNQQNVLFAPQQGDTIGPRHVLVKYPMLLGTGWDIVNTPETTVKAKVLTIETVIVPGGTFSKCYKLQLTTSSPGQPERTYAHRWLAPGVGLVKQHNIAANGSVSSVSLLRQFATGMSPNENEIDGNRDLFGRHHFKEFDANRDGFLSAYECGPPEMFEAADVNRDNKLSPDEFIGSEMYRYQINRQLEQASREFWALDLDFDMQLNEREALRQVMLNLPRVISAKDIAVVDQDENGKLGYREFHLLYQRLWKEALDTEGKPPKLPKPLG